MKSIKPGRGASIKAAVGGVIGVVFSIFWTIMAMSMGAPVFFPIFGIIFIIMSISSIVFNFKNATGKNRTSLFDIVDDDEESDPLNEKFFPKTPSDGGNVYTIPTENKQSSDVEVKFCPYCGVEVNGGYEFCPSCGRRLP